MQFLKLRAREAGGAAPEGRAAASRASTRASPAARRSATRSSSWRCWSRSWRSSTRPTRGLDIDALKNVAEGVNALRSPDRAFLVITHYQRLLDYIKPDVVHVLADGRIVESGGPELALELEAARLRLGEGPHRAGGRAA